MNKRKQAFEAGDIIRAKSKLSDYLLIIEVMDEPYKYRFMNLESGYVSPCGCVFTTRHFRKIA